MPSGHIHCLQRQGDYDFLPGRADTSDFSMSTRLTDRYLKIWISSESLAIRQHCMLSAVSSHGEDYLHNYVGMLGIPLERTVLSEDAKTVFLTEARPWTGILSGK